MSKMRMTAYHWSLIFILAANSIFVTARSFLGDEPRIPLTISLSFSIIYITLIVIIKIGYNVNTALFKIIVWLSFGFMLLAVMGEPEVPDSKEYGGFFHYLELAWAGFFCLGSLFLFSRAIENSNNK